MLDQILDLDNSFFRIEILPVVIVLVLLEAILSADNAIALAALVRSLPDPRQEEWALRYGIIGAFVLRIVLILTATWVIKYWQFELAGAVYLLWLGGKYFFLANEDHEEGEPVVMASKMWQVITLVALTDLAFSLDSVTAAVAVAQETWLVLLGGVIGIIALRFLAELFINWLAEFARLEAAGYLIVLLVGLRLLLKVIADDLVPPEWLMLSVIGGIFIWGFSQRQSPHLIEVAEAESSASLEIENLESLESSGTKPQAQDQPEATKENHVDVVASSEESIAESDLAQTDNVEVNS
ncbi:Integral membrane protein TerC [Thalassoporum mexicanum PCC 7367]|uniref:TerC family protein n=1 Tax=Thalassoporum mexicanum TaxID=3457544 RepID=UPI00029FB8FA|nr:integral membrane protein TerC [Pseudanabaena sp. PCC 7367]AFY69472.1 Integral membrane protein TerC [Pseudanabaena sp. PCC 7367]